MNGLVKITFSRIQSCANLNTSVGVAGGGGGYQRLFLLGTCHAKFFLINLELKLACGGGVQRSLFISSKYAVQIPDWRFENSYEYVEQNNSHLSLSC